MSVISSAASLSEVDEGFSNKIEALEAWSEVRGGWGSDTPQVLGQHSERVGQLMCSLAKNRTQLSQAQSDLDAAHALLKMVQQLSARLSHINDNLPSYLPRADGRTSLQQPDKPSQQAKTVTQNKAASKPTGQKTRKITTLEFITVEEFESVPKYIRGRLQYDQVNQAASEVNRALEAKYNLLARPRNKLSLVEMTIVRSCKTQENADTKGVDFVVGEDIKRWSSLKLDSCGRSLLLILRTLKRLREVRGPGSVVRFAVI